MVHCAKNEKIISATINTKQLQNNFFSEKSASTREAFQSRQCPHLTIKMFFLNSIVKKLPTRKYYNKKVLEKHMFRKCCIACFKETNKFQEQQFSVLENVSQKI